MKSDLQLQELLGGLMRRSSETARYLWQKGWAEANAGNLSINARLKTDQNAMNDCLTEKVLLGEGVSCKHLGGCLILISGTGARFRDIADDPEKGMCVIRITDDGKAYQYYNPAASSVQSKPTSELATHLKLHDYLAGTHSVSKVVLHTHPTELVALTHIRKFWNEDIFNGIILGMLPEVKVILSEGAGLVDYALPGSVRLADATLQKLAEGYRTILWQKHGCLAVSDDPIKAFDMIDILNKGAQVLLNCLNAGEMPEGLSKSELQELEAAFNLK